ncbi:MAG TPA: TIGR03086 family metal-binding protein [Candidatus Limnocylindrales bacterium]|nr:TIGR03086 family metal-binding protein [Candidatus Limnocylindrales bacterium]
MTEIVDLSAAAGQLSDLIERVDQDRLGAPTPCDDSTIGDVLDHISGVAQAFRAAAAKELGALTSAVPAPDGSRLRADWRVEIPKQLAALVQAWADPSAWEGMTQVGGVDLPGAVAGQIAHNEIVLHGWDLAQGSGLPYQPDSDSLQACLSALSVMYPPEHLERRQGIFGPPVDVPQDAPLVDRVVAFSGRDPSWTAHT